MKIENILSILTRITGLQEEFIEHLVEYENHTVAEEIQLWYEDVFEPDSDEEPIIALMEHLDEDYSTCESYIADSDYYVLTDEEADELWEEYLENYIDDCMLPELPESVQRYFDRDAWISDAKFDGRGHSLSSYDGNEHEVTINSTIYYIYRKN